MKIVGVDNHAQEDVADELWLDNIPEVISMREQMQRVCDRLNRYLGDGPGKHYSIKPDAYRLSRGMEDLV